MQKKLYLLSSKFLPYFLVVWLIGSTFQLSFGQIINHETRVVIDNNGKKTTNRTVVVQVNSKQENWLSHIELRHNPRQEFSFNYAFIADIEGNTVRKLKKKELSTRHVLSYQTFYQDDLITEFDLYWNQYPYRVEYSYTIKEEEYLYIAWWTPLLYANVPTIESSLEIDLPSNYEVKINLGENITYERTEVGDRKILSWRSPMMKKLLYETYAPPAEKFIPIVKVVPIYFKYGVPGKSESWSSFGLWLEELNEGTDGLPVQEKRIVEKLIEGIEDENKIINTIYQYLQNHTKYVNVAMDVGGLKSYPASYVCENKYGDCKALTTYMKAMLRYVGIESFYTIIKAGENKRKIDVNFPSQQFNHVILMIPVTKDTIWLENTSSALPFNYLGTFTQNRYALVINGEKSQLVKTPKLLPADVLLEREYNFQLSTGKKARIDLDLTLRGKEFEDFRYFISEKDEKGQNNELLLHTGIGSFQVKEWSIYDFDRNNSFLRLNAIGTSASVLREIGSFQVINPLRIDLPDFDKPDQRELDVVINYPIDRSDKSVYDLKKLELIEVQIPEGITIESEYGWYSTVYLKEGDRLIVKEKFTLFANEIPIDKYTDFYQFIEQISAHKKKTAILIK